MKLIVGLGNPGREYENTRHNIGFRFLDHFAEQQGILINKNKFNGDYIKTRIFGEDVILLKPLCYMNLSGEVVFQYINYFKVNVDDILVISDDLDLYIGNYKLKSKGSAGGHNGLKSIEHHLDTQDYKRLKIGISNNKLISTKDYVLGKFSKDEEEELKKMYPIIDEILEKFIVEDFYTLVSKYNTKNGMK